VKDTIFICFFPHYLLINSRMLHQVPAVATSVRIRSLSFNDTTHGWWYSATCKVASNQAKIDKFNIWLGKICITPLLCMHFTFAKNHWIIRTHSNVTNKI